MFSKNRLFKIQNATSNQINDMLPHLLHVLKSLHRQAIFYTKLKLSHWSCMTGTKETMQTSNNLFSIEILVWNFGGFGSYRRSNQSRPTGLLLIKKFLWIILIKNGTCKTRTWWTWFSRCATSTIPIWRTGARAKIPKNWSYLNGHHSSWAKWEKALSVIWVSQTFNKWYSKESVSQLYRPNIH